MCLIPVQTLSLSSVTMLQIIIIIYYYYIFEITFLIFTNFDYVKLCGHNLIFRAVAIFVVVDW
jgi:ascorbate-specific PTS system EIIC-type component UlaA